MHLELITYYASDLNILKMGQNS